MDFVYILSYGCGEMGDQDCTFGVYATLEAAMHEPDIQKEEPAQWACVEPISEWEWKSEKTWISWKIDRWPVSMMSNVLPDKA